MALKQGYIADKMATKKKNHRGSEQSYYKAPPPLRSNSPFIVKYQTVLNNHDCNTSHRLIPYDLFKCWKFTFVFDLQLRGHQLHVPEHFQVNTFQFLQREYTIIKKTISNMLEIKLISPSVVHFSLHLECILMH